MFGKKRPILLEGVGDYRHTGLGDVFFFFQVKHVRVCTHPLHTSQFLPLLTLGVDTLPGY